MGFIPIKEVDRNRAELGQAGFAGSCTGLRHASHRTSIAETGNRFATFVI
jgi:hypothetical protein